jgi:hypothetical protein
MSGPQPSRPSDGCAVLVFAVTILAIAVIGPGWAHRLLVILVTIGLLTLAWLIRDFWRWADRISKEPPQ